MCVRIMYPCSRELSLFLRLLFRLRKIPIIVEKSKIWAICLYYYCGKL